MAVNHRLLEDVYREQGRQLMALAATLAGPSNAEDVVSAAIARAAGRHLTHIDNLSGYLARAVINEARVLHRSSSRRSSRESRYSGVEGYVDDPRFTDPRVIEAIRRRPMRQRVVLVLTYWADLSTQDVADRLGISEGSVHKHLARARSALRKELS